MKSFKDIIKETVNPPKSEDEKAFVAKHIVDKKDHPVAKDDQFVAKTKKDKTKKASYEDGEDEAVYEAADVHTKRADKKAVIVHDVDPKTGESKTTTRQARTGEVKVEAAEDMIKCPECGEEYAKGTEHECEDDDDLDEAIVEKAESKAQAIAARIALAAKRGKLPKSKLQGASKDMAKMSEKDLVDFTKVKKDAPYKVDEETQLDELSPNTLHRYVKKATGNLAGNSAANAAIAAVQVDKPKAQKASRKDLVRNIHNRMKGITSASGRLADKANMAEEYIDEAFSAGTLKLKDGSTVQLDKENAKAVNTLFNELNSSNKKKMEAKMMESKKGFSEIVKFAKEAM